MEDLLLTTIKKLKLALDTSDGEYGDGVVGGDKGYVNQFANRFLAVTRYNQGQQVAPCILIRVPYEAGDSKSRSKVFSYRGSTSPREMRAFIKHARQARDDIFKDVYGMTYTMENLRAAGFNIGSRHTVNEESL